MPKLGWRCPRGGSLGRAFSSEKGWYRGCLIFYLVRNRKLPHVLPWAGHTEGAVYDLRGTQAFTLVGRLLLPWVLGCFGQRREHWRSEEQMKSRTCFAGRLAWLGALILVVGGATRLAGQADSLFVSAVFTAPGSFTQGIEGPACDAAGLLYAVNYGREGTVGRVDAAGTCSLFVELPAGSVGNGIRFDSRGFMLVADYRGHKLLQVDMQSRQVSVRAHEPRMSQPNDLAIGADDRVYASDPDWGKSTGQLWRIDPDGKVALLEGGMGTTNGVEVAPGDRTLYVNESVQLKVWAYDLSAVGEVSNKRLLIQFPDFGLDGMRCDVDGNLYIARYGKGTVVMVSPQGQFLREVQLAGQNPSNLEFGGPDGRTCFVTLADQGNIERFRVDRPGRSWQLYQQRQTPVAPSAWGQVKHETR